MGKSDHFSLQSQAVESTADEVLKAPEYSCKTSSPSSLVPSACLYSRYALECSRHVRESEVWPANPLVSEISRNKPVSEHSSIQMFHIPGTWWWRLTCHQAVVPFPLSRAEVCAKVRKAPRGPNGLIGERVREQSL